MGKYQKNGKIDFLKFVFALVIVCFHAGTQVLDMKAPPFLGGAFAVEFFFIVSGYLFMASIARMPQRTLPLGTETGNFMLRKFKGFYPEVAITFVMGFVLDVVIENRDIINYIASAFPNAVLLNMTGISVVNVNAQLWYLSAMLLCMMVLYPLVRKYPEMMTNVVLPLTALLIFGNFCVNKTSPRGPREWWMDFTYKGNLRAFAELSIGICLYPMVNRLKNIRFTKLGRILLTVVEWACYIAVLEYMRVEKASRKDYFYIAVYAVAILLSFCQKGIDTNWFQKPVFFFLGKISFPLFLAHNCWAKHMNNILPADFSNKQRFVCYIAVSVAATVMIMVVSALLRKLGKALKEPAKKLLLAKQEEPAEI